MMMNTAEVNMSIYVHHNPGNIDYNSYMLMFVHGWYMPTQIGEPVKEDTWLRVPAMRVKPFSAHADFTYTPMNNDLRMISTLDVAEDTGKVLKAFRARPGKNIGEEELAQVVREAVDISAWEKSNEQSWPFKVMFDQRLIKHRFEIKHGTASRSEFFNKKSTNLVYNQIRAKVIPKPCNCGRPRYT